MPSISVVIHTKDAGKTLERALKSVVWADDIVVMDMQSKDNTLFIAKKYKARIFSAPEMQYADPVRNEAIQKAKGPWVLVLDADEEVPEMLAKMLQEKAQSLDIHGYFIPRKNMIFGRWAKTGWWPDYILRFFQKKYANWSAEIHSQPTAEGKTEYLELKEELALIHHNYVSVEEFVGRMNRYTSIEAEQKPFDKDLQFLNMGQDEFNRRFFAWRGYEQGTYGLALSMLQACSFVISSIKRWEKAGYPDDEQVKTIDYNLTRMYEDTCYWMADMHIQQEKLLIKKVYWKIRRKLKA